MTGAQTPREIMVTLIGIMMPLPQAQEITGMVEREKDYVSGVVDFNDQFRESKSSVKVNIRTGCILFRFGKFEPDFCMLKEPVSPGKLSFRAIQQIICNDQDLN